MKLVTEVDHKKAVQAVNFFSSRANRRSIDKLKVIKLIYLADRYHLRKYGRPITNDEYWAMLYGPVGSITKRITEDSSLLSQETRSYARQYLNPTARNQITSITPPDLNVFSDTEKEAFYFVVTQFADKSTAQLVNQVHKYPEWKRFEAELNSQRDRKKMTYDDFFSNPKDLQNDPYKINRELLEINKELFTDSLKLANSLS